MPSAGGFSIDGNVNFYDIDPFNDPYHGTVPDPAVPTPTSDEDYGDETCGPCRPKCFKKEECITKLKGTITTYDDHIVVTSDWRDMILARSDYYLDRLSGLTDFDGFVARLMVPQAKMYKDTEASGEFIAQTLFFIDSRHEIYADMGVRFPVVALDQGQAQIH